jgi:superfamily II DNA/RNA helicase
VATPGRVIDLLDRGVLNLKAVQYLVVDETDRMLDMGFSIQVNQILRSIPKERQTLLFSATVSKVIESMSQKYLNEPVRIEMGGSQQPAKNIVQETITVGNVIKFDTLVDELERRGGTSIVFSRTKRGADKVAKNLNHEGLKAAAIHGDLNQRQRERVLKQFRDQKINIMVATDVAARGIDVSHVSLVVNYDLPQSPQDYIHRIGRTARAGAKGTALSFISPGQEAHWEAIEHFLETGQEIPIPKKGRAKRGGRGRNNSQGRRSGSQHGAKKTASGEGRKSSGGRFKGKATGAKKSSTSRGKKKTAGRGRKQEDAQPSRGRKTKSTASKHANQDRKASPSKKRGQRKDDKQFSVKKSKRKPAKAQRSSAKKQRTKTPFA